MRPKPVTALILGLVFATDVGCGSAKRVEPVSGIIDAFASHQIVALGEGLHGNTQSHAFRLALIRDRRFAAVVNDIVVESGSARYQAVMDRFIRGGDVPDTELRKAWQDTTQPNALWDSPIYEEFFRAVRTINRSLSPERQLRVLLGDPPIDWDNVHTTGDLAGWISQRDRHAADLIEREVLSRSRRALVIYGDGHFLRHRLIRSPREPSLLNLIERQGARAFAVWTNTTVQLELAQRNIASWPVPSLTLVRGTKLGKLNFKYFGGMETEPPPRTMEEQFDAVLYLGPVSSITFSEVSAELCADAEYMKMRLGRLSLGPSGEDAVRLETHCADFLRAQQK